MVRTSSYVSMRSTTLSQRRGWRHKRTIQVNPSPQAHSTPSSANPVAVTPRPKNVILFGETGVGKSSVINLIAGKTLAKASGDLEGCTLEAKTYRFTLSEGVEVCISDTVGLEEPEIGINTFMGAIEKAHQLVKFLNSSGGIDLLLFCIRGGRMTAAMQRSYRLFYEVLCGSKVPLAIIVTNLEQEDVMEEWWVKNEKTFQKYGICAVAHACITAVPARVTAYASKREESRETLRKMLLDTLSGPNPPYVQETQSWLASVTRLLRSFLVKEAPPKKGDLVKTLEKRCKLSHNDALRLAQMITEGDDQ